MRIRMLRLAIAATAALGAPATAAIGTAPVSAPPAPPEVASVAIPFAPPLDRPLRYQMTRRRGSEETTLAMSVTFSRAGDGFRMSAQIDIPPAIAGNPLVRALQRPMVFTLDRDGVITAVADEAVWWREAERILDIYAEQHDGEPRSAEARRAMIEMLSRMRQLPDPARLDMFARNYQPIVEFSATSLRVGESVSAPVEHQTALGTIVAPVRITLAAAEGDLARFEVLQTIPEEQMATIFREMLELAQPPSREGQSDFSNVSAERRQSYAVDRATGLTTSFRARLVMRIDGTDREGEVTTLERVDR